MLKNSDPALYESFLAARSCHQRGDLAGAEAIYSRLLSMDPADDELLFFFGRLQVDKGEIDVGLECLRMAEQLKPGNPQIPFAIGIVLQEAGRVGESIELYRKAVTLDSDFRIAWENLCAACYDIDDYSAGLEAAQAALALDPTSLLAIRGVANCLTALGRRAEALAALDAGVNYHPALPELRIHRAWELMANDRFSEAWPELEWRNSHRGRSDPPPRSVPYPRWNGEALSGKTILVYGEQGVGDEIMYAPFVHGIVNAGAKCILECDRRLEGVFARAFPECTILRRENREQIPWHASLPRVDFCVPALSLPLYFRHPLDGAPFLAANPERKHYWRDRLLGMGGGLKVGVSWRGGADAKARKIRSIPEEIFGDLIDDRSVFVSLQYGATADEVRGVSPQLVHFPEIDPLTDIDEFVALLSALDVVISIDNSTVHIAGALGVRTLLLLPVYSEWRWGGKASGQSRWYRSLSFIRQKIASDQGWRDVLLEARWWLEEGDQTESNAPLLLDKAAEANQKGAAVVSPPAARSALLLGDTNYWYHWGCSCTSLGLHEGLRTRFEAIQVVPLVQLLVDCPVPNSLDCLDSEEFFSRFSHARPDILAAMQAADAIVINGEGSIHGTASLALVLLYLAYVAKLRLKKQVAIVNHSCFPGAAESSEDNAIRAFYARVYRVLDLAVVREQLSFDRVSSFGGVVSLGFDCLPLFLEAHSSSPREQLRKIVLSGSVAWSQEMVDSFSNIAHWGQGQDYEITVVSGAKALLASDEIGFVERMVRALDEKAVMHQLVFPLSEMAWLDEIGSAALVVSGRFHYSIAAAFLRVPFLLANSNTAKTTGLLQALALDPDAVGLAPGELDQSIEKAKRLLLGGHGCVAEPTLLAELLSRARLNFSAL